MKKCTNCGKDNRNENQFCSTCGGTTFEAPFSSDDQLPPPPQMNTQAPTPPPPYISAPPMYNRQYPQLMPPPAPPKKPFTAFDVFTILGFVSSLVGLFQIWIVLEPLALVSAVIGFFKGGRNKGLAAAAFVIAVIAFIIRLFNMLYDKQIIDRSWIEGIFR